MAPTFWETFPECELLAQIATELGVELRLRGSVALRIASTRRLALLDHDPWVPHSLFDFVPPFSNIDLVAPSPEDALAAGRLIRANSGLARFFRWQILAEAELEHYPASSHFRVIRQPEISFLSPAIVARRQRRTESIVATYLLENDKFVVEADDNRIAAVLGNCDIALNSARNWSVDESLEPLIDLLFLARNHPQLLNNHLIRHLIRHISRSERHIEHVRQLRRDSPEYGRFVFSLLKLLYPLYPINQLQELNPYPSSEFQDFFRNFCSRCVAVAPDPQVEQLFSHHSTGMKSLLSVVRPEQHHGRWLRRLHRVDHLGGDWQDESNRTVRALTDASSDPAELQNKPKVDMAGLVGSPIISLEVDDPPPPGCCRYQDFSRGHVEVAWPNEPISYSTKWSGVVAVDLTSRSNTEKDMTQEELVWAHAYTLFYTVGSIRTDYNFLSILAGKSRTIQLFGVGVYE